MNKSKLEKIGTVIFTIIVLIIMFIDVKENSKTENIVENDEISYEIDNIPEYNGEIYAQINNNIPKFEDEDFNIKEDYYSELKNGKVRGCNDKNKLEKSQCR